MTFNTPYFEERRPDFRKQIFFTKEQPETKEGWALWDLSISGRLLCPPSFCPDIQKPQLAKSAAAGGRGGGPVLFLICLFSVADDGPAGFRGWYSIRDKAGVSPPPLSSLTPHASTRKHLEVRLIRKLLNKQQQCDNTWNPQEPPQKRFPCKSRRGQGFPQKQPLFHSPWETQSSVSHTAGDFLPGCPPPPRPGPWLVCTSAERNTECLESQFPPGLVNEPVPSLRGFQGSSFCPNTNGESVSLAQTLIPHVSSRSWTVLTSQCKSV